MSSILLDTFTDSVEISLDLQVLAKVLNSSTYVVSISIENRVYVHNLHFNMVIFN